MDSPEPELLKRFAQGDLEAFESLFRRFQGEVYGWIVRIVRDPGSAEDLTIDTFWRAWRARARFDPARGFAPWARRIATNVAIEHLKRPARREVPLEVDLPREPAGDPAVASETLALIREAFSALPVKLRATATLALVEERPYEEIAGALDISTGAVKTRVFRAVRLLREKLTRMGVTL